MIVIRGEAISLQCFFTKFQKASLQTAKFACFLKTPSFIM
uniref:Uncharacterized protein n=1 Tax=Arundo donax TaxID=35708 RepID=A0A0A8ZD02_ARUDO